MRSAIVRLLPSVWTGASRSLVVAVCLASATCAGAQERDRYILGEQRTLEIVVHVWGEVQRPGEYRVPDQTDVLELLSKAGGPTEFASLTKITITHNLTAAAASSASSAGTLSRRIERFDVKSYLQHADATTLPRLLPGDVVTVPRNSLSKWKQVFGILRDVSVVASAYFLYLRATKD